MGKHSQNDYSWTMANIMYDFPAIKEVIFHPPATIINWRDGIKTVVKCRADDEFDCEKGLALCVMKRMLGDQFHKTLKQYIGEAPVPNTLTMEQAQDLLNIVERYLNDHPGKEILGHRTDDGMKTRYEIIDNPARKERNKEKCCATCTFKKISATKDPCAACFFYDGSYRYWTPEDKAAEPVAEDKKLCKNCMFYACQYSEYPCNECIKDYKTLERTKWEPKPKGK